MFCSVCGALGYFLPNGSLKCDRCDNIDKETKKIELTAATFCSKFTKMNKNPEEIITKITKDGISTIDLTKEKKNQIRFR